jgi:pilus assembly protein CpaD
MTCPAMPMPPIIRARARRIARRAALAAAVTLAGAWLAGCKTVETNETFVEQPYDYRHRHPIAIAEGTRTFALFVGRRRGGLTPAQRSDVDIFAENWHRDAAGGIEIRVPTDTGNARAAHDTVPEIERILVAAGVPRNGIAIVSSHPADPAQFAPIVLAYPRIAAAAGPCGEWPNDLGPGAGVDYDLNRPYWNLGCSMQRNLAAMVDNPADLVQPRGETPPSAQRRSVVLEKYRKGEDTTTQYRDNDKAKISDVGK